MDCSLPGSSVHAIFQARILEWVAISFSFTGFWCISACLWELPKTFTLFVNVSGIWMDSGGLKTMLSAGSRWIKGEGPPPLGQIPQTWVTGRQKTGVKSTTTLRMEQWLLGAHGSRLCVILVFLFVLVYIFQNFYSYQDSAQQPDKNSILKNIFLLFFFFPALFIF